MLCKASVVREPWKKETDGNATANTDLGFGVPR